MSNGSCPICNSTKIKKRFLAVPPVFGISPATVSVLLIVSGLIGILVGLSGEIQTIHVGMNTYEIVQREDTWAIKVIVGVVVALIGIIGLMARNYICKSCGKIFFTPNYSAEVTNAVEKKKSVNDGREERLDIQTGGDRDDRPIEYYICPDCAAGGIIPTEDGKCTNCGYIIVS